MIAKFGGRKFIFALFVVGLSFALVLTGTISSTEWLEFTKFIGVTYVAGNIITKATALVK